MEVSGQLHAPVALPQGKSPWHPMNRTVVVVVVVAATTTATQSELYQVSQERCPTDN